ncbi:hypothetical protein QLX08_008243 [Tetragonisca angustula]|uniref:Uncharacterized protein n=1 Tax=Tetragonisca angustula TaxID=166442 RepID=A0AAW0ZLH3_9HYME
MKLTKGWLTRWTYDATLGFVRSFHGMEDVLKGRESWYLAGILSQNTESMHGHRFITRVSADVQNSPVMFHHYFQRSHNLGTGQAALLKSTRYPVVQS